jgi:hypothetical protein
MILERLRLAQPAARLSGQPHQDRQELYAAGARFRARPGDRHEPDRHGSSTGNRVIAEGIELIEDAEFLRENGCDEGQGHYFGKAVPPAVFAEQQLRATPRRANG